MAAAAEQGVRIGLSAVVIALRDRKACVLTTPGDDGALALPFGQDGDGADHDQRMGASRRFGQCDGIGLDRADQQALLVVGGEAQRGQALGPLADSVGRATLPARTESPIEHALDLGRVGVGKGNQRGELDLGHGEARR